MKILKSILFILFVSICFSLSTTIVNAGKPAPAEPIAWPQPANLAATRVSDTSNQLTWNAFTGFAVFGYDIYYGGLPAGPGANDGRIATGANGGSWTDLEATARCAGDAYWIVAYAKGRKKYSLPEQGATATLCDGGDPGDPYTDPFSGVIDGSSGFTPACTNQTLLARPNIVGEHALPAGFNTILWQDEFQAEDIDTNRWNSAYAWGPDTIINNESQYYVDALGSHAAWPYSPFEIAVDSVSGAPEYLVIKAQPTADTPLASYPVANQAYISGVLTTRGQSLGDLTEGFFEVRAKMAPGNGTWSAFWLNHTNFRKSNEPEIDVIEYLGQSRDAGGNYVKAPNKDGLDNNGAPDPNESSYNTYDAQFHTYWHGKGRNEKRTDFHVTNSNANDAPEWCGTPVDYADAFHVYSVAWNSNSITWYIDDIEVFQTDSSVLPIANEDMYVVLNLATGNPLPTSISWPGAPDEFTNELFTQGEVNMVVDYVRVYKP